jgi:hypothetical protein
MFGQTVGDYRSASTGVWNWNIAANWQIYTGSMWITASDFPGQTTSPNTVTTRPYSTITINENITDYPIQNLVIEQNATIILSHTNLNVSNTIIIRGLFVNQSLIGSATFKNVTIDGGTWQNQVVKSYAI